jgi:putative ABC transport system substrate-binding protein
MIRRREFITLLGGAVAAWPYAARAQRTDRIRRIGVFMNQAADDPEGQARNTAFVQALQQLGWTDGRNARIDTRWGTDAASTRKYAAELVALAPQFAQVFCGSQQLPKQSRFMRTRPNHHMLF